MIHYFFKCEKTFEILRSEITSDDLHNIDNPYFAQMVSQIYPNELQLNKANPLDTEAPF